MADSPNGTRSRPLRLLHRSGGGLWTRKGWSDALIDTQASIKTKRQVTAYTPFVEQGQTSFFTPERVAILSNERVVQERFQPLDRPEVERRLINMKFPIVAPVLHERSNRLVAYLHPIGLGLRSREGPRDVIYPNADEIVYGFAADVDS
jgi:hypothetical protein